MTPRTVEATAAGAGPAPGAAGWEIPGETLADRAHRVLRERLLLLDIAPGAPIAEAALAAEIGVGRTPLREAVKRLEADHLVVTYPRRGTFAAPVDLADLAELTEIRAVVLPLVARRAAAVRGGTAAAALGEALAAVRAASGERDPRRLLETDLEIHALVDRAAASPFLAETLSRLDGLVTRMWCLVIDRLPPMGDHIAEHEDLIRAILDGDGDRAAELATAHVRHFDAAVRGVL